MATLTIRNVPEEVKRDLRLAAAERGVSMEQEARDRLARQAGAKTRNKPTAEDILGMARALKDIEPLDPRYKTLSQKEISDLVSEGKL